MRRIYGVLVFLGMTGSPAWALDSIILDNTANGGRAAVTTNMNVDDKDIPNHNVVAGGALQVMQNNNGALWDYIGPKTTAVSANNGGNKKTRLNHFGNGHMLLLDKLRKAADTLAGTPSGLTSGTYGSISWSRFLANVEASRTMYGIVRVKVPLEKGAGCSGNGNCKNALGEQAKSSDVYGFCRNHCSGPGANTDLRVGQIKVYGALLIDFVDKDTDKPVDLANLPEDANAIQFKVSVPVLINPAENLWTTNGGQNDYDAQLVYIDGLSKDLTASAAVTRAIDFNRVPGRNITLYNQLPDIFGKTPGARLDLAVFDALPQAQKYRLLMPSGYDAGWATAINMLTGNQPKQWSDLGFALPATVGGHVEWGDIRQAGFEDLPAYMYTGGTMDLRGHVNISGLVYAPQALELVQGRGDVRQYISGSVVVRDGFFLRTGAGLGYTGGATLLSFDPDSLNNIRIFNKSQTVFIPVDHSGQGGGYRLTGDNPAPVPEHNDKDAPGAPALPGGTPMAALEPRWVEVRPQL